MQLGCGGAPSGVGAAGSRAAERVKAHLDSEPHSVFLASRRYYDYPAYGLVRQRSTDSWLRCAMLLPAVACAVASLAP